MQLEEIYHKSSGLIEYRYGVMKYEYDTVLYDTAFDNNQVLQEIDEEIKTLKEDLDELKSVIDIIEDEPDPDSVHIKEVYSDDSLYYLILYPDEYSFHNRIRRMNGMWSKMKFYTYHSADMYHDKYREYVDYDESIMKPISWEDDVSDIKEQIMMNEARIHFLGEVKTDIESTKAVLK